MAIKISEKSIKNALIFSYDIPEFLVKNDKFLVLKILKKIFFLKKKKTDQLKNLYKSFLKFINLKKKTHYQKFKSIEFSDFKKLKVDFKNNDWVYLENFIDIDSINILKKNWPKNYFFTNRHMPTKYYLTGLKYLYRSDINDEFDSDISNNPYIHFFYSSIKSDLMKQKIRDLTGDDYRLYSIISSNAHEKSFLAPHMDTVASVKDYKNRMINCIFFVEGNDDDIEYSGGTGIYKDNNFEEKIFQPKTINNSILIYNSTSNFFHGFKTLKKNCYRKAITFQFQREIKKS